MRWDELFTDLEIQAAAEESEELAGEVAERSRYEAGQRRLLDRLGGFARVDLGLCDGQVLSGSLVDVGADWVELRSAARQLLVPEHALAWVRPGPSPQPLPESARPVGTRRALDARLRIAHPLRRLARDRAVVHVDLAGGGSLTGTVDRVGADHLDVAEHAADDLRRPGSVRSTRVVAVRAVSCLSVPRRQREVG